MNYTSATYYFDYESEAIQALIQDFKGKKLAPKEKARQLYYTIRDGYRYDPYFLSFSKEHYRASYLAKQEKGHCIDKAIVLIACLRGLNIPARIRLAKVKNHIGVERLTEKFGTNVLTPHGMAEVFLDGKWLKITPAFNKELCRLCMVEPLDFDGENDSVFQHFTSNGTQFMEYLEDYGPFEDVPLEFMEANARAHYGHIFGSDKSVREFRL